MVCADGSGVRGFRPQNHPAAERQGLAVGRHIGRLEARERQVDIARQAEMIGLVSANAVVQFVALRPLDRELGAFRRTAGGLPGLHGALGAEQVARAFHIPGDRDVRRDVLGVLARGAERDPGLERVALVDAVVTGTRRRA